MMLTWRWFAKVYGWTPDQVEELPLEARDWLPLIEEAAHEASDFLSRQAAQTSVGPRR
jgi:hypothetical protein